ncbi:hypothetical protein EI42_05221 [Thermosporothrix hazakensis]|jgi:hypothetical protein|uniref:Uncharacterized protein n=1 Tax=Thermosporothrix hazakensis TaxID=644383 RepID=A0A326TZH4_THEHA|nr:hypothetical protein [Thermosporothrix hazakensis]PZW22878.1 hypothetical protein EI42_05221 [Thermosporothrix hazakensis]GCE48031.1 hypothetical protein KTH_29000 [Thermosporothrix hazakensis]
MQQVQIVYEYPVFVPSMMLDTSSLSEVVVDHKAFFDGCQDGFEGFLEIHLEDVGEGREEQYVLHLPGALDVVQKVVHGVFRPTCPFQWLIGYYHGWFSALALYDAALASLGHALFVQLVLQIRGGVSYYRVDARVSL